MSVLTGNKVLDTCKRWTFLLVFFSWFFFRQLCLSNIYWNGQRLENLGETADQIAGAFFLLLMVLRRYHWKEALATLAVTALFIFSSQKADHRILLMVWLCMAAARDQDLDQVFWAAFAALLLAVVVTMGMFFAGMIEESIVLRDEEPRHSLGFMHPNVMGMALVQLVALWVYLRRRKLSILEPVLCLLVGLVCYFVADSRASVITTVLLFAAIIYLMLAPKLPTLLRKLMLVLFTLPVLVCNFGSVYMMVTYKKEGLYRTINRLFSGRLSIPNQVFTTFGLTPFGAPLPMNGGEPVAVDNSYVLLLLNFGIACYVVYTLIHLIGTCRVAASGNEPLTLILAIFSIHAIIEKSLLELRFDVFLIALIVAVSPHSPLRESIRTGWNVPEKHRPKYLKS